MSSSMPTPDDFNTHMVYTAQQRLDGYSKAIQHAMNQKTRFDRKILESEGGKEIFTKGQLVQVYQNDLAKTIGSERKLALMWLEPHRIVERLLNSYKLEMLQGQPLDGEYHVRRIQKFISREGTELAAQQKEIKTKRKEEDSREEEGQNENAES